MLSYFADDETIRRKVPEWLRKPETAALLEEKLVLLGEQATAWMRSEAGQSAIDLPGRIETAVNALDTAGFQTMLDRLMAEHLGAIQVLGYVLGAAVGALQCA